ncbi:MAG: dihydroorotate dehydrogenase-like protein [Planctomycetota bacterium]
MPPVKLGTHYLGLSIEHPFMVGPSPLTDSLDSVCRMIDAGASAVVLRSLFQEQLDQEALAHHPTVRARRGGQAVSYFPEPEACPFGPEEYLDYVRLLKRRAGVPVVASLNGHSPGDWLDYAMAIDEAGADALELNLFFVATDPSDSCSDLEEEQIAMVEAVKRATRLPIAVKLSPFYTSLSNFALRLQQAGADGLVLFNRFFEADIDLESRESVPHLELSSPAELLLRLRWLSILSASFGRDLAVSGGVHGPRDAAKAILCGATAVQVVSAALQRGHAIFGELRTGLSRWLDERGETLEAVRGSLDIGRAPDPAAFERANYLRTLSLWPPE